MTDQGIFRETLGTLFTKKKALEISLRDAILERVQAFQETTGVSVSGIDVRLITASAMGREDELISMEVRVSLDLEH